jgi:hypothetical protein
MVWVLIDDVLESYGDRDGGGEDFASTIDGAEDKRVEVSLEEEFAVLIDELLHNLVDGFSDVFSETKSLIEFLDLIGRVLKHPLNNIFHHASELITHGLFGDELHE